MKPANIALAAAIALVVASGGAEATGSHAGGHYTFGSPAKPEEATRTVAVTLDDQMRIQLELDAVKKGEVLRFVVTNKGAAPHEFSIGDTASQRAHAAMMKKMPDMKHEGDPSALTLAPGETKELTWRFDKQVAGAIEVACQMPGHYDAGMVRKIRFDK